MPAVPRLAIAFLALLGMGPNAAAPAAAQETPSSPWKVDWGERYCTLSREVGDLAFGIRVVPGLNRPELILTDGSRRGWPFGAGARASVRLTPSGEEVEAVVSGAVSSGGRSFLVLEGLGETFLDQLAQSTGLALAKHEERLLDLSFPLPRSAVAALNECSAAVAREWGVDPAFMESLRQPPQAANGVQWIRWEDYPASSIRQGNSGMVVARLSIDSTGRVAACDVVSSSGDPALDRTTCRAAISRARYRPALNEAGEAVSAPIIVSVRWSVFG